MKMLILIGFMLCVALWASARDLQDISPYGARAEKVMQVYNWEDLISQLPPANCEIVSMDGISVLKIAKTNSTPLVPLEITLLTITNSSILKKIDSINFDTKYENVPYAVLIQSRPGDPAYYVQASSALLSRYPAEAQGGDLDSNLLSDVIEGTSNWKPEIFSISRSLHVDGTPVLPIRLDLKITLPETGTIYLRPLKLMGRTQNWWSPQMSGLVGGIGGTAIGCLGALIGILASMGKARRFVLTTTVILIVAGILLVIAGIIAVAMKQPYAVWYPLLLGGAILAFVLSINVYSIKRRYDDLEIRRMTSMDAAGG